VQQAGPAEILRKWALREIPTTIGVHSIVLLALRRGLATISPPIAEFLAGRFKPAYADLLVTGELGKCLDRIRTRFRNPACHGSAWFDQDSYADFARLAIAQRNFGAWNRYGPESREPRAEVGVFHHHLFQSQAGKNLEPDVHER
jgi:hypothetical protein